MTDKERIIAEIERLLNSFPKPHGSILPIDQNAYNLLSDLKIFIDSLSTEQLSEDLEKEIDRVVKEVVTPEVLRDYIMGFKTGAQWQKEQTINKACEWLRRCVDVDGEVKMIDGEPEAESFIRKNLHRIEVAN